MSQPTLRSWGLYPNFPQASHLVHWRAQISGKVSEVSKLFGNTLPYGNGRSYGDSCLAASDHVIQTRDLDRFIFVDWSTGVIIVESGVTIGEILALCVPHGWFLPVVPGTQYVTVGGAVANDIHGKNHHMRGTFGRHLRSFGLLRTDHGELSCSAIENPDHFRATIGGLGLTGVITWIELQLIAIGSSVVELTEERFGSLDEFFAISDELDSKHEYAVAWLDCLGQGHSTGRGVYGVANHVQQGELTMADRTKARMRFTPPVSCVNGLSLRAFNTLYYRLRRVGRRTRFSAFEHYLFPLDRILDWNRAYGPRGFQQFQCVLPEKNATLAARELLAAIATSQNGSFLAVMKRCGRLSSPGLMSFPLPGLSIALDFPQNENLTRSLFPRLDTIVREAAGRFYPAKDAHMSAEDFMVGYPAWQNVEALRDPALNSRFWRRVTAP